jgi:glycosyltransferase involved in cell wall biosynthesis
VTPAVSVCIPTYNGERFIGLTIESVLSQTFADFELIIVDDASTDGTVARIEQFKDSRIQLVRSAKNLGLAGNWNAAVEACSAPLIKLLCHDDLLYRDCLAEQVKAFTRKEIGFVSSRRDVIDEAGRVVLRGRGARAGEFTGAQMLRQIVRSGTNPLGEPSALMFRREVFEASRNSLPRYPGGGLGRGSSPASVGETPSLALPRSTGGGNEENKGGGFRGERPYMIDVDFYARALTRCDAVVLPATLSAFRVSRNALSSQLAHMQAAQAKSFFSDLAGENPSIVSKADLRIGLLRATLLAPARRLFYRWRFR